MDIALVRSFLEVAATGSFVAASERLFVTQSAVSLRIQRLEDQLGQTLFIRSKAGARLTQPGRQFERYATSILRTWEEARQQVSLPERFTRAVGLGAQPSLWPRLGFRWIDALRAGWPEIAVRAETGSAEDLTRALSLGTLQAALLYAPILRPGLRAAKILSEELVLVSTRPGDAAEALGSRYVMTDWGPDFAARHAAALPDLSRQGVTMSLGAQVADYLLKRDAAAYQPARYVARHIADGRLHPVEGAPIFEFPVWSVFRQDLAGEASVPVDDALRSAVAEAEAEQDRVLQAIG
ncbi:DNA-binding transcriptional LysR family regulator [Hasllibacter halocynthiae]|uniref:DNA-binding transcriptional LysR family regulator n=1 Tax=Hasllibacter halocynthiae TaxID=595589 RepID=A0A2T0X7X5_9RHOB|nr:LysR family transcriptional regulator [Hasllibacter halocynthiae]PRY95052.1 DNA-binding transcriptional LysR family regulator [Hasllibacter halocynthiae]